MIDKIMELDNINTFWEDVKELIGFYDGKYWEDWEIKRFQATADYRYEQLLENIRLNKILKESE